MTKYICGECGEKAEMKTFGKIYEKGAITASKGICDICKQEKYISSERNYGYPNFN